MCATQGMLRPAGCFANVCSSVRHYTKELVSQHTNGLLGGYVDACLQAAGTRLEPTTGHLLFWACVLVHWTPRLACTLKRVKLRVRALVRGDEACCDVCVE